MPLDDAYQTTTDAALLDMAQRPQAPRPQAPAFSMWGTVKAAPKGVAAGAAEATGSTADILGAFGQVMAATDARPAGMFSTPDRTLSDVITGSSEEDRARKKMLQGIDFNSDAGRLFRNVGKDYMPDPVTAHGAEQAVANLFRLGGKAVGAAAVLGPAAGAVVAGAEEGFTTSDELGQQGVDLATRTKVGGVTAAITAAGLALPVAGQTVKGTVGLALAGGPVSFIAQNAATREILQNADYAAIGDRYDPFDPVGLTLSTLLPLGFGALAMRGMKGAKAGEGAKVDEPVGAPRPDAESVDAARVNLLRENVDNTRLTDPTDLAGAAAHDTAMTRAIDQMADGERVAVSDVAPEGIAARVVDELGPRVGKAMDEIGPALKAAETPPGALDAAVMVEPALARSAEPSPVAQAAPADGTPEAAATVKLVSESPAIDRAANLVEAERPDLMVHLDGMDAPMKLSELMKSIREDLGRELQESPLIEAAAACFVSTGG